VRALLVFLLACSPAAPRPTPPAAAPAVPLDASAPTPDAGAPDAAPPPAATPSTGGLAPFGCAATRAQRDACIARGPDCELIAPARADPCANKGTRCDDLGSLQADNPPCACYCGDEYRRAHEQLNPPREPSCTELTNLETGKTEQHCEPPVLPR
jgi:hypothetical protein